MAMFFSRFQCRLRKQKAIRSNYYWPKVPHALHSCLSLKLDPIWKNVLLTWTFSTTTTTTTNRNKRNTNNETYRNYLYCRFSIICVSSVLQQKQLNFFSVFSFVFGFPFSLSFFLSCSFCAALLLLLLALPVLAFVCVPRYVASGINASSNLYLKQ